MDRERLLELVAEGSKKTRGGGHRPLKLTDDEVLSILQDHEHTAAELAEQYEVSVSYISSVRARRQANFTEPVRCVGDPPIPNMDLVTEPHESYYKSTPRHALTDLQVLICIHTNTPLKELAKEFGVSVGTIHRYRHQPYDPPEDEDDDPGDPLLFTVAGKNYYQHTLRELALQTRPVLCVDGKLYTRADVQLER